MFLAVRAWEIYKFIEERRSGMWKDFRMYVARNRAKMK